MLCVTLIAPSVCGGDAALRQIVTICYYHFVIVPILLQFLFEMCHCLDMASYTGGLYIQLEEDIAVKFVTLCQSLTDDKVALVTSGMLTGPI